MDDQLAYHLQNETCPNSAEHNDEANHLGYVAWHAWAKEKAKTHRQERCPGCGFHCIWVRRTNMTPEQQAAALEGFRSNSAAMGYSSGYTAGLRVRDEQITALLRAIRRATEDPAGPMIDVAGQLAGLFDGLGKIVGSDG